MNDPERFADLPEYAFPRLRRLLDVHEPGAEPIAMSVGEPRHDPPPFVAETIAMHVGGFAKYPSNPGSDELLAAVSVWLRRRYGAAVDPGTRLMALNGTREGLFNAAIALCPEKSRGRVPVVLIPNPFYQVYAVAALAVGARPEYVPATAETGFLPDYASLPASVLDRTEIAYLCSPSNPQGAVASREYLAELLRLADTHDFRIFADECYSEIYRGEAPVGILEVAQSIDADPERVVVFNSLSKRSNLPGLRSGFVAAGPAAMTRLRQLRDYAGAPLPSPLQHVAARAWGDEAHVEASRARFRAKYEIAEAVFAGVDEVTVPQAGLFLWLPVEDGEAAALRLWTERGVRVLPGAYLGRGTDTGNPGQRYVRAALVAGEDEVRRGLIGIRETLYG